MKEHNQGCGVFTISLDFELYWGLRDLVSLDSAKETLLNARKAVHRLLRLFKEYEIHATWGVVGFLFFDGREELQDALPSMLPTYKNRSLFPYGEVELLGSSEADDPFHFAPSLVRAIVSTPYQEIGTHTFSHFYCLEEGQNVEAFCADLQAAAAAADRLGIRLRSMIFPRNQFSLSYLSTCQAMGIEACRTNLNFWAYHAVPQSRNNITRRILRFLDSYCKIASRTVYSIGDLAAGAPCLIPASRFLRPYSRPLRVLEPLRFRRIAGEMSEAAIGKKVYHLWWHPHNFGIHTEENIAFLRRVFDHYCELSRRYAMMSLNMSEIAHAYANPEEGLL